MAGSSMTFTYERLPGPIKRVVCDWVSDDATGAVSGTTGARLSGRLVKGVTDPGAAAPTDNYDITLTDQESADALAGCQSTLANRDTANTEVAHFLVLDAATTPLAQSVHPVVCGTLTVAVANAGNSKAGRLVLYLDGEIQGDG